MNEVYNYEAVKVDTLKEFVKQTKDNKDYIQIDAAGDVNQFGRHTQLKLQGYASTFYKNGKKDAIESKQLIEVTIKGYIQCYPYTEKYDCLSIHRAETVYCLLAHKMDYLNIQYYISNSSENMRSLGVDQESLIFEAKRTGKNGKDKLLHTAQINKMLSTKFSHVSGYRWGRKIDRGVKDQ